MPGSLVGEILDVTITPSSILLSQRPIEGFVALRRAGVPREDAALLERAIQQQGAIRLKHTSSTCKQPCRHGPWSAMRDVGREDQDEATLRQLIPGRRRIQRHCRQHVGVHLGAVCVYLPEPLRACRAVFAGLPFERGEGRSEDLDVGSAATGDFECPAAQILGKDQKELFKDCTSVALRRGMVPRRARHLPDIWEQLHVHEAQVPLSELC
mmetsp:Transcript_17398/g.38049  ORF Transcript_17398/g.38049 Transcript_17398/m.38049 type:complete len:211 (-) Transcript_17398:395-1027(-)